MSSKGYRSCLICGRRVDQATGLCPTPEACDKLRAPLTRLRREASATAERLRQAALAHEVIGLGREQVAAGAERVDPRRAVRSADASRRARAGWVGR